MRVLVLLLLCSAAALWVKPTARAPAPNPRRPAGAWIGRRLRRSRQRGQGRDDAAVIGAALTSVAARLRAGQGPDSAWGEVIATLPEHLATRMMRLGQTHTASQAETATGSALHAAEAATRLAQELGTELAPVLEACAEGIEESARAAAERDTAFAAPRATARLLLALPLAGVVLGAVMGARPWALFTSSLWGGLLAVTAAVLLLVGRWWIARLLERAGYAGEENR